MYGRKIKLVEFRGEGSGAIELLGGGKEKALADAVRAAKELGAFADISAITIPYADALAQQKVVNIGSPYPSREWFVSRRPYSWSLFPDGTNVVESGAAAFDARFPPGSKADYAGPSIKGKTREVRDRGAGEPGVPGVGAALHPQGQGGGHPDRHQHEVQARHLLDAEPGVEHRRPAQGPGITSVLCACDPVMLALGMTPKANEQGYEPEWITVGARVRRPGHRQPADRPEAVGHAFGIAYNAESEPQGRSFPYAAFKQMRPKDEPAFGVEEIYYQMYLLAIGIQMAGPNLTPQTFEAGMFAYPGGSGPRWPLGLRGGRLHAHRRLPRDLVGPDRISAQNNKKGAWVQLNGGARWSPRKPPTGPAGYFKEG